MPFFERFDKLLIYAQMIQKKSLRTIGEEAGLGFNALVNYKYRKTLPTATNLVKLAEYFGVSTDYLLGREGYELETENNDNWFYPRAIFHNRRGNAGIDFCSPLRLDAALRQFDIWLDSGYEIKEAWLQSIDGRRLEVERRWAIKEGGIENAEG